MNAADVASDAPPVLGIDLGGVVIDKVARDVDTSFFGSRPMDTPVVEGSLSALERLTAGVFEHRVHIVSKAGQRVADLSRRWLHHIGFFEATGISEANLWFVEKRPEKAGICDHLDVTHFVDDRLDVLDPMTSVAHRILFSGGAGGVELADGVPDGIIHCRSWLDVEDAVARSC